MGGTGMGRGLYPVSVQHHRYVDPSKSPEAAVAFPRRRGSRRKSPGIAGTELHHEHLAGNVFRDIPADRMSQRRRYQESLDEILSEPYNFDEVKPCVKSKVFGIGVEADTAGSAEFTLLMPENIYFETYYTRRNHRCRK